MRTFFLTRGLVATGLGAVALTLVGCGDTHILTKSLPDETQVVDGPSLALPPSFELRPPRDAKGETGYVAKLSAAKTQEARELITGSDAPAAMASSTVPASDAWLLNQAAKQGNVKVDPNVRQDLEATTEVEKAKEEKKSLWQKWFGPKDKE